MDFPARWRETTTKKWGENGSHYLDISPVTTLVISHPACLAHDMGEGHPERPDRLRAVERALESEAFQMLARDVAPRADCPPSSGSIRKTISTRSARRRRNRD